MKAIVFVLLFANLAAANNFAGVSYNYNPSPPAGSSLVWRLTHTFDETDYVELVIPAVAKSGNPIQFFVTPDNAQDFEVDFAAWSQAVVDPTFNLSTVDFGGIHKREFWNNQHQGFQLDRLQVYLWNFDNRSLTADVQTGAMDFIEVPKPNTATMAVLLFGVWLLLVGHSIRILGKR